MEVCIGIGALVVFLFLVVAPFRRSGQVTQMEERQGPWNQQ